MRMRTDIKEDLIECCKRMAASADAAIRTASEIMRSAVFS